MASGEINGDSERCKCSAPEGERHQWTVDAIRIRQGRLGLLRLGWFLAPELLSTGGFEVAHHQKLNLVLARFLDGNWKGERPWLAFLKDALA